MRGILTNKRGQFESKLLAVVLLFIVGILLFFLSHLNTELYGSLDDYFNTTEAYNDSEARDALNKIQLVEQSIWDWAFLAIFIGIILQMVIFSFATRINVAFYWIFAVLGIIILIVGTMLSNMWQEIAGTAAFSETIARFPITNLLLGTYFPIVVVAILFIGMIVLFGKPPRSAQ